MAGGLTFVPGSRQWLQEIYISDSGFSIIVFFQRVTNHIRSSSINIFVDRTFYRLRLVRNLNGREFIVCSGKT